MKSQIQRAQKYLTREKPRPDKAIGVLKKFLKRKDTPWPVFHLMGVALLQKGKYTASADYLEKAINKGSDEPETYHLLGVNFFNLGKFDEAERFEREALNRREDFFEAWLNMGGVYRAQARLDEALECYQKANKLDPRSAAVAFRIGAIYRDQGDLTKALELFDITLKIKPDYIDALMEKAEIFKKKQQFDKAEECLNSALEKRKGNPAIRVMIAELYKERGNYEEAISIYESILSEHPEVADVRINYALCLQELGRFDESERNYLKALEDKPDSREALSNYLMGLHYNPKRTKEEIFEAHLQWDELIAPKKRNSRPVPENRDKNKRLRIGFISGGFRRHPVGWMITRALEQLPKNQFEIYCYTTNNAFDPITRRIHSSCDIWRSVVGYNNEITAKVIRDDEIDILVELSGHAADNRLKMVDLEPAPVVVKWVGGLFNTTGLRSIDYLLTDWYETPAGEEEFYTEKLVRLPDDYVSFLPPEYAPPVSPLPAEDKGYVTFGCFNNPTKINKDLLEQWANIMNRVPNSRLFLKSKQYDTPALTDRIIKQMANYGISEERLIFEGYSLHEKLLETYSRVDIALDAWPYSGGLTTCEALWMGVPVVTKPGPTFAGRHSTTHLTNAGFPEWVAETWEKYIDTAVSLAGDTKRLAEIRAGLRDTLADSPVCDGKRFAAHLSVAFREMWKQRIEGYEKNIPEGEWQDHIEVKTLSEEKAAVSKVPKNESDIEDGGLVFDSSFLDEGDQQTSINDDQANDLMHETTSVNGTHKDGIHQASNGHLPLKEVEERPETFKIKTKDGVTICTPGNLDLLTPYVLLEQEEWFEPELNFVRGYLKPGMNILDIGAGFGAYALSMAKLTGEEGTVYAFEPGSVTRRHLEMSKLENKADNLEIIGRAVADQTGKAPFYLADTPELNRLDEEGDEEVSQTTLDAWWEFEGRPGIDFIKLDVNDSETKALIGAEELLAETSPVIQFAVGEGGQQLSETFNWLSGKGYHVYEYVPGPQLLTPHDSGGGADPYLMNLIAIKGDRTETFKKSGWLHDEAFEPREPEAGHWKRTLRQLPWTGSKISGWEQQSLSPQNKDYLQALDYLCAAEEIDLRNAQNQNTSARSEKAVLMLGAAQILIQLYNSGRTSLPVALTLARVLTALGKRGQAVDILKKVMKGRELGQQDMNIDLPFLLPLPVQDEVPIHTDFAKWLIVRVTEAWILLKDVTTYLSSGREKKLLKTLEGNPESSNCMKRRIKLFMREGINKNLLLGKNGSNEGSTFSLTRNKDTRPLFIHLCFNNMHTQTLLEALDQTNRAGRHIHYTFIERHRSIPHFSVDLSNLPSTILFDSQKDLYQVLKKVENTNPSAIIVHGLFFPWQKEFIKKVKSAAPIYWSIWGGDLYNPIRNGTPLYDISDKIDGVITRVDGDYELFEKTYGKRHRIHSFSFGVSKGLQKIAKEVRKLKPRRIVVGNSGDPSNNHIQILKALSVKKDIQDYQLYIPFAYNGSREYLNKVQEAVRLYELDKITTFQTKFIPSEEYNKILMGSSYLICAHERQQGLTNIHTSLYFGNIVFVRREIDDPKKGKSINPTWRFVQKRGLPIHPFEEFLNAKTISEYQFPDKHMLKDIREKLRFRYDLKDAVNKLEKGFDEIINFNRSNSADKL